MLAHVSKKTSIERVHPEGRGLSYDIAEKIEKLKEFEVAPLVGAWTEISAYEPIHNHNMLRYCRISS